MFNRFVALAGLAMLAVGFSTPAAAEVNYSAITSAVDFTSTITAIAAVAALVALVLVARKGIRFVMGALR